nr:hypothetical protein CFP56_32812 [Quercus suber]
MACNVFPFGLAGPLGAARGDHDEVEVPAKLRRAVDEGVLADGAGAADNDYQRYAASTTIDEIGNLTSQNEVSLENLEVENDQRSPEINVACSRVSSQDTMPSKSKKRRLTEDDELGNVISQSFDNVSMAIDRATKVMAKCFSKLYGAEVHETLGVLDLDLISNWDGKLLHRSSLVYILL